MKRARGMRLQGIGCVLIVTVMLTEAPDDSSSGASAVSADNRTGPGILCREGGRT